MVQARCLTYLAVAHRRAELVEPARDYATRTLELASKLAMVEYVAMAHANLAWVAWREGDKAATKRHATEALTLWHAMEDPYGFDWMALWPLTAEAVAEDRLTDAVEHLRGLFGPDQHPLAGELATVTREAIAAFERDGVAAKPVFERVLEAAHQAHQL